MGRDRKGRDGKQWMPGWKGQQQQLEQVLHRTKPKGKETPAALGEAK